MVRGLGRATVGHPTTVWVLAVWHHGEVLSRSRVSVVVPAEFSVAHPRIVHPPLPSQLLRRMFSPTHEKGHGIALLYSSIPVTDVICARHMHSLILETPTDALAWCVAIVSRHRALQPARTSLCIRRDYSKIV